MPSPNLRNADADPPSNPEEFKDTSPDSIQFQSTYEWLTTPIFVFFQWLLSILPVISVATLFQGARNVIISGKAWFTNIGINMGHVTTVNYFGGTQGLENLKEFVSFAALHDSSVQDPDRRCHPGTRENVLKWFRDWFDNPNSTGGIFWLHGPAGAGKSAIAQTIANEYKERGVAATFFFYRSDPSRNDGNRLFPTIAWQLALSIPPTKDFIIHALDETPHLPTQAVERQFEQLVAHPTNNIASQMSQPAPVVIIDGVDECSDEKLQQRFLAGIGDAVKNHRIPLRFLIASRPEALIEETLKKFKELTVSIDLAKLDDSNRDIQKYLEDKFPEIAFNRGLDPTWPGREIIEEIVSKSSGNFIFAAIVIRFISDEDCDPEFLLSIVRNLTPRGHMSPFALLDELFLEILKQQRDQIFLKTFLALLVARSSIEQNHLHEDDATLMNVSEKDLHIRLRRMRSLLKFKPFIDVYHKSFHDFLQDPSRSGQYHVSKHDGQKRYLELIVDSVVRHISMAVEQPDCHETCSNHKFKHIFVDYSPKLVLPIEDWQEALKPFLDLQDKLLNTSKPQSCRVTQVMRDLLLHLAIMKKIQPVTAAHAPKSNDKAVTKWSPSEQNILKKDLDSCLAVLLSCPQTTDSMVIDEAIIDRMSSLLAFGYAEIVTKVRSFSYAQKLFDLVDLLSNNKAFLIKCGPDATSKAAYLGSEILARVPLLPRSLSLHGPTHPCKAPLKYHSSTVELVCQTAFVSRILDHNYVVPLLCIHDEGKGFKFVGGNVNEQNETIHEWLKRSRPNFMTRIRIILEVARTIEYVHSMDAVLFSPAIDLTRFTLDSNLRAKVLFIGSFAWWVKEASLYGHEQSHILAACVYESNIFAFACLFHSVCFDVKSHKEDLSKPLVEDVRQLIERCRAKDPKSRPTMEDVVKEMKTWHLI